MEKVEFEQRLSDVKNNPLNQRYKGVIHFGDASLVIQDNILVDGDWTQRELIKRQFKKDIMSRFIQQLNRMGWVCKIPEEYIERYGYNFALDYRICQKGDLFGEIELKGRFLEFQMWQNLNTPDREDKQGKYQFDKEKHAPYLLRIEMYRTRNKLKQYFMNVCGFTFKEPEGKRFNGYFGMDAESWVTKYKIEKSCHYNAELGHAPIHGNNDISADGKKIKHGDQVYFYNYHGRLCKGKALFDLNMMWNVITGKHDFSIMACYEIFIDLPGDPSIKNPKKRLRRLEQEKAIAIQNEDYEKAILFRDLIKQEAL